MYCQVCEGECQPVLDIEASGRIVQQCPKCNAVLGVVPKDGPPPPARIAQQQPAADLAATDAGKSPVARGGGRVVALPSPTDIVASARERLAAIRTELQRLADLQREERKLQAMVDAADAFDSPPQFSRSEDPAAAE